MKWVRSTMQVRWAVFDPPRPARRRRVRWPAVHPALAAVAGMLIGSAVAWATGDPADWWPWPWWNP